MTIINNKPITAYNQLIYGHTSCTTSRRKTASDHIYHKRSHKAHDSSGFSSMDITA